MLVGVILFPMIIEIYLSQSNRY